ncbi:MAG: LamG domain-containing protein [Planctomycetes bacterium]|nr:LamG domain-containing protein [Planctomycetota bacterium]
MIIQPTDIEQSGPGIDLSNLPEGVSVKMSDPVKDFKYARNAVTLVYDLSAHVNVRLSFAAMEYGDEPHAPLAGPFGDDADFDGVAVSADGVDWYEVQDLRSLRSDRFTTYDIDLDTAIAALGLSYGSSFKIRFCQYDNNPAPMDGIFLHGIELLGDLRPPILHLTMDDNASNPTVLDSAASQHNQTFLDPGGNPNTNAHSVPGAVGSALAFDGVDDCINLGNTFANDVLAAGHDFTVALWAKFGTDPFPSDWREFLSKYYNASSSDTGFHMLMDSTDNRIICRFCFSDGSAFSRSFANSNDDTWHHYALVRQGATVSVYRDGTVEGSQTNAIGNEDLSNASNFYLGREQWESHGYAKTVLDDFRVYDRALTEEQIQELFNMRD